MNDLTVPSRLRRYDRQQLKRKRQPEPPGCDLCPALATHVLHGVYLCRSCAPEGNPELLYLGLAAGRPAWW